VARDAGKSARREELLAELAALCGIEPSYYDLSGRLQVTGSATQEALLTAMGCQCRSLEELEEEVTRRRGWPWTALVEPVLALYQEDLPATWSLYLPLQGEVLPADLDLAWTLTDEAGSCWQEEQVRNPLVPDESRWLDGTGYGRIALPLPPELQPGTYRLAVDVEAGASHRRGEMLLIIAPRRVYLPEVLRQRRLWGLNLQLYALASQRNWGMGDCADLQVLVEGAGRWRADIIGLNPLHHLGPYLEDSISPYYPTSRCFLEPLYLALEQVPELTHSPEAQDLLASREVQAELAGLRQGRQVNYPQVAQLKQRFIPLLWAAFVKQHGWPEAPQTPRGEEFAAFLRKQGEPLWSFATFLALADHWRQRGHTYRQWQDWPAAYHEPHSPAVRTFQEEHQREIFEHAYTQWLLQTQLAATQRLAQQQGLAVGLYLDLAVGVNPGGFDTWRHQELFAREVDIGAPPDDFSPLGQNWHLVPLVPQAWRAQGYRYFFDVLRHNCLPGGALRLDHVMGLFRLYWIPRGADAAQGAYVRYPAEELLKILALISVRQQTAVVGEDLGTVEPKVRERLAAMGVFSTRLFYFERQDDGAWRPPDQYPEAALAATTTHDLPTLAGFWQGRDIQVRRDLHLLPDAETANRSLAQRQQSKTAILTLLSQNGEFTADAIPALAAQAELPPAVKWGIIAHLAATPCRLILLNLEDIFGWLEQQNLPGTKDEYPNWRLKLPLSLEELALAPEMEQAARIMATHGRGNT